MDALTERRESARLNPRTAAFVALPELGSVGSVKDISLNGVGCEFMVYAKEEIRSAAGAGGPMPADLFASNQSLCLRNVRCRIAYDRYLPDEERVPGSPLIKKRCGLRFEHLDSDQSRQLRQFLKSNTAAET